jgi:hypothetical protein
LGLTAIQYAVWFAKEEALAYLLDVRGCDPKVKTGDKTVKTKDLPKSEVPTLFLAIACFLSSPDDVRRRILVKIRGT